MTSRSFFLVFLAPAGASAAESRLVPDIAGEPANSTVDVDVRYWAPPPARHFNSVTQGSDSAVWGCGSQIASERLAVAIHGEIAP